MRTLVVFYSHSGHTRQVAVEIARHCGADLEEIRDARPTSGAWTALRSIWDSLTGAFPPIEATSRNPSDYDLVILGTPVWAGRVAPPMRSYVSRHVLRYRRVAFFCTEGAGGDHRVFAELRRLCRQAPVATLFVTRRCLPEPAHREPLQKFMRHLMTVRTA